MAKGSRSSVRKTNNTKLKARVFGPVENARTERLSAKLMELAAQPKPPKVEMDVEESVDAKSAEPETKETSHADGASSSLSVPIPESLARVTAAAAAAAAATLPSPPPSPSLVAASSAEPAKRKSRAADKEAVKELLFFHLLGVCSDVQGFDGEGNLVLGFASDRSGSGDDAAMDLDGKSSQPRTSSIKAEKRRKEEKIAKIAKKRHRKAVNTIAFPKSRVAKSKKGGKR
ncbi:hypothetical protein MBLNU459_g8232t1 [Dothideomycetes sp. NU459]